MAGKGFPAKPAAIAKIDGTYRPDRHGSDLEKPQPQFLLTRPDPPQTLNADGVRYWIELLDELLKIDGLIAFSHLGAFEQMCYNHQIMRQCQPELDKGLTTIDGKTGNMVVNPYWKIYDNAFKNFIALTREFGCTPSSMDRIRIGGTKEPENGDPDISI